MRPKLPVHLPELPPQLPAANMLPGLRLLLEAHAFADQLAINPWEFGLELSTLENAGLSRSQVRWLLSQGYIQHALDITPTQAAQRAFQQSANLTLHSCSCFILTPAGIDLFHQLSTTPTQLPLVNPPSPLPNGHRLPDLVRSDPAHGSDLSTRKPHWLADCRELRLGEHLVKKYRRPAANQITLLTAFEEDGWPHRIDNPLPPTRDGNDAERLQEAIRRLNHCQQTPLLRFHGDGTGSGVTWEIAR